MWKTSFSIETKAAPEKIWSMWSEVKRWPEWDEGLEAVTLNGPFTAGSTGTLQPKGGPVFKTILLEVEAPRRFTDRTFLPLTRLDFHHEVKVENGRTRLEYRVEMSGLLTPLFSRVIGRGIAKDLPETVRRLVEFAEKDA